MTDSMTAGIGNGNTVHLAQVIANAEAFAILQRICGPSGTHVAVGVYLFTVAADIGMPRRSLMLRQDCSIDSSIWPCGLMRER